MQNGNWDALMYTTVFLMMVWMAGRTCKLFLLPPIVGEIIIGIVMGPHVLDIMSHSESAETILSTFGTIGVTMIIMESGMHVNFNKVYRLGWRVWSIGLIGTLVPMGIGILSFYLFSNSIYPDAFVSAIIITPASVGVSLRVLISMRKLNTDFGQAIIIAAYEDDLGSLILFIILRNVSQDGAKPIDVILPVMSALVFVIGAGLASVYIAPALFHHILKHFEHRPDHSYYLRDDIHMTLMFVILAFFIVAGHYVGSHLLGAFLAGVVMSRVVRTFLLWETQVKSVMSWLLRLFFSATVAFSIPIDVMMSWDVVWKGFIVGIICVVVKIIPTLHLSSPNRWIVGIALVGRGEFSYIIAEYAITEELITYTMYSVIVWGLLISTLIAPIVLQILLRRVNTHHITSQTVGKRSACRMVMEGHTHIGIPKEISDIIDRLGFDIADAQIQDDQRVIKESYIIYPHNPNELITEEHYDEIREAIQNAYNDPKMQVYFEPIQLIHEGLVTF